MTQLWLAACQPGHGRLLPPSHPRRCLAQSPHTWRPRPLACAVCSYTIDYSPEDARPAFPFIVIMAGINDIVRYEVGGGGGGERRLCCSNAQRGRQVHWAPRAGIGAGARGA